MKTWQELIAVPKELGRKRKREVALNSGHSEWLYAVRAECEGRFSVLVRTNEFLIESFSLVLLYEPPSGKARVILRVNGDHGEHMNRVDGTGFASGPHLHLANPGSRAHPPKDRHNDAYAILLDPRCQNISFAWARFCAEARLSGADRLAQRIAKLYSSLSQEDFGDAFETQDSDP